MVLGDALAEEHRLARPLKKVVVHRKVEDIALFVAVPVLTAVGGEDGMLDGKDERPARREPAVNLFRYRAEVRHVVQRQRTERDVKGGVGEVHVLHGGANVAHIAVSRLFPRHGEHLFGDVHARHRRRAVLQCVETVPAVAAAEVEHAPAGKVGQQRSQRLPFARRLQTIPRARHLAVLGKKRRVVVAVFSHGPLRLLPAAALFYGAVPLAQQVAASGFVHIGHELALRPAEGMQVGVAP